MKKYCENCAGHGWNYQAEYFEGEYLGDDDVHCDVCDGKGYVEDNDTDRLAAIGHDLEYLNGIHYAGGDIPTVEFVHQQARIWRDREKKWNAADAVSTIND